MLGTCGAANSGSPSSRSLKNPNITPPKTAGRVGVYVGIAVPLLLYFHLMCLVTPDSLNNADDWTIIILVVLTLICKTVLSSWPHLRTVWLDASLLCPQLATIRPT